MLKIKVSCSESKNSNILIRQTPNSSGIWKNCKFYINKQITNPDWWFVLHGSGLKEKEKVFCDPSKIVYISLEASETQNKISEDFINQFAKIVISDQSINHKNIKYQNGITWYVGISVARTNNKHNFHNNGNINYDYLTNLEVPIKNNKISVIVSNKISFPGHLKRLKFIKSIMNSDISNQIDLYGHGFREVPDKLDAIIKYKYHLVLENNAIKTYWSEKLGDSFLGYCLPIYYGCKNINDYFPEKSIINIDIENVSDSLEIIRKLLKKDIYNQRLKYIKEARNKILNKYNIFNLMYETISLHKNSNEKKFITLIPNEFFFNNFFKRVLKKILNK